jgi:hypothetical protein
MMKWLSNKYHDIKRGLGNILAYIPIAWKDRDWDMAHTFTLLEFKFGRMIKDQQTTTFQAVDSDRTIREIQIAKELCKRLANDNYESKRFEAVINILDPYDKDWFNKLEEVEVDGIKYWKMEFNDDPQLKRFRKKAMEARVQLRQADLELLTKLIQKRSNGWWS